MGMKSRRAAVWVSLATIVFLTIGRVVPAKAASTENPQVASDWEADAAASRYTFNLYWENDGGPIKRNHHQDRHYTNGLAASMTYHPAWADDLSDIMPFADDSGGPMRTGAGFVVGQLIFTPRNIDAAQLLVDDRPYAGYLYAGIFWERANDRVLDHVQVDLGVVGPASGARDVQVFIHKHYNADAPQGWSHQLKNEATIQTYLRRKWRFELAPIDVGDTRIGVQFIPEAGVALGTVYRYAQVGAMFRMGVNLPDDFGPGRLADVRSAVGGLNRGWTAYGFARATGRVVEHNIFLDGNTFRDSHRVTKEPLVGELQLGVAAGYGGDGWAAQVTYSQTLQTEEFVGQDGSDGWGALTVGVTGWF